MPCSIGVGSDIGVGGVDVGVSSVCCVVRGGGGRKPDRNQTRKNK